MGYLDKAGLSRAFTKLKTLIDNKADVGHTHTKSQITDFAHTHDDRYYTESEINSKLSEKANSSHTHTKSQITDFPTSMPASDVYAWAKASSKPSYTANEVGAAPASHSHNIIVDMGNHNEIASGTTPNSPTAGMASSSTGLYLTRSYDDTTAPTTYGNILNVVGSGTGQLFMGWSGNDSTSQHLYYRSHRDTSTGGWGQWNTIIDSSNIGSQSVSHANTADSVAWTNVSGRPSSMPASDVYSWAKQSSKPSYSASEVGAVPTSRKVNGKALSSDISISAGDVGAAPSSHSHNYAGSSSAGGSANWANGADYANYAFSNNGVSTSGDGSAYEATISGFSLGTGKSIVIIPNVTSTTTTPTLNVSGTGAKNIRMRLSSSTSSTIPLINSNFLTQYKPVKVTYDGTYWVIDDFIQPDANNLYGTLISSGSSAPSSGTAGFIYIQTT